MPHPRPIAIALIRRGDDLLVFEGRDDTKGEAYYRPLGGGIEQGELGADTIVRELREEVGATVHSVHYLGLIENRFVLEGKPKHELVLVYGATLDDDPRFLKREIVGAIENGQPMIVKWISLAACRRGESILYPVGLLAMIDGGPQTRGRGP